MSGETEARITILMHLFSRLLEVLTRDDSTCKQEVIVALNDELWNIDKRLIDIKDPQMQLSLRLYVDFIRDKMNKHDFDKNDMTPYNQLW